MMMMTTFDLLLLHGLSVFVCKRWKRTANQWIHVCVKLSHSHSHTHTLTLLTLLKPIRRWKYAFPRCCCCCATFSDFMKNVGEGDWAEGDLGECLADGGGRMGGKSHLGWTLPLVVVVVDKVGSQSTVLMMILSSVRRLLSPCAFLCSVCVDDDDDDCVW